MSYSPEPDGSALRYGWTTGSCAAAAVRAAAQAVLSGASPEMASIRLPGGEEVTFPVEKSTLGSREARSWIVKDAGDDPDVTHGAVVSAKIQLIGRSENPDIQFSAGRGVGVVTRPGLSIPVGEPAINPVPRQMIRESLNDARDEYELNGGAPTGNCRWMVTLGVEDGELLATRTWNPRLGIVGGLSILGTTGRVVPYSCSAWIHSIQRGVDVAMATNCRIFGAALGAQSEKALGRMKGIPATDIVEIGNFIGGLFGYIRRKRPAFDLVIAGGPAKMLKFSQGARDLHSRRCQVDMTALARCLAGTGISSARCHAVEMSSSMGEALDLLGDDVERVLRHIAVAAAEEARASLADFPQAIETLVCDRREKFFGWAKI